MRRVLGAFLLWHGLIFGGLGPADSSAAASADAAGSSGAHSDQPLLFGQSAALSGPASQLGLGMRQGLLAAFEEVNRSGGVHGRLLTLVSLDDAYEPEAAIANTRALIREREVFALVGAVGTPTSRAVQPLASEAGVPYVAPFTGAGFLREAGTMRSVVNLRASYIQETAEIVARLKAEAGARRIGVLYQNDSYGRAGLEGVRMALAAHGLSLVAEADYPRNTESIKVPLLDLRREAPDAVIIIGAYRPAAAMIRWSRKLSFDPVFANLSFVGSAALARELGPVGRGVYITQVVPFPEDSQLEVVARYRKALKSVAPDATPDFVSLEGYLAGRLVAEGVRLAKPPLTRAGFLAALREAGEIQLGGLTLSYGPTDNQGSDQVYLTVIDAHGRVVPAARMTKG